MNSPLITKFIAGGLLVCATLAGMFCAASTLAGVIGGNFNLAESNRHRQIAEFSTANQAAAAKFDAAEIHCDHGLAVARFACHRSAQQVNIDAHTAARVKYKGDASIKTRIAAR